MMTPSQKRSACAQSSMDSSSGIFKLLALLIALVAVLWMYTLCAPFIANAITQHGWRLWTSLALGLAPVLLVLAFALYALSRLRKTPRFEQLVDSDFPNKIDLQRRLAEGYLANFKDLPKYAFENGFAEDTRTPCEIVQCLKRLKGEGETQYSDCRGWLLEFGRFQTMQEERAKEIVSRTWKLVAVKTAASPWRLVDMAAVFCNSTIMVVKIARLYNRRTSPRAAFRLVCRWFVNICIAGEIGDATQGAVEWANANDLVSSMYKPIAGAVGRLAEGGANAFLVYRLGMRAIEYFKPLAG